MAAPAEPGRDRPADKLAADKLAADGRAVAPLGPAIGGDVRAVVLVEGASDQVALEVLAARRGRDLAGEGIRVVAMAGAMNIGHFLTRYGPSGRGLELAGLCDAGEEAVFRRGCERAGLGSPRTRADLERLGFFVCVADLEEELIRCLGTDAVQQVIAEQGESRSLRSFQDQPAQRHRTAGQQLRRFMGTRSGRKAKYAGLLAGAVDLARVPVPLDAVLTRV